MSYTRLLIGLAVTAGFLWFLAKGLNLDGLTRSLAGLSPSWLIAAVALLAVGYAFRITRWWWMLRTLEPGFPFRACVWPFLTSFAVNNVMPFRAGDALRVLGFRRELQTPPARLLGTLFIERLLDCIVLVGIFAMGVAGLPAGAFPEGFTRVTLWAAGTGSAAVLSLLLLAPWLGPVCRRLAENRFVAALCRSETVARHGRHFAGAFGLLTSVPTLLTLVGLSIVAWACEGAVFAAVAASFPLEAAPAGPWLALAAGTLATLLPSSPGYVGTFDYFAARGVAAYGASPESAAAFAVTVHAVLWFPLTASGLVYLALKGARLPSLRSDPDPSAGP